LKKILFEMLVLSDGPSALGLDPIAGHVRQEFLEQVVEVGAVLLQSVDGAARPAAQFHGTSVPVDPQHGAAFPAPQPGREFPAVEHHAKDPSMLRTVSRTSPMIWS
jgi:hypothetical protein